MNWKDAKSGEKAERSPTEAYQQKAGVDPSPFRPGRVGRLFTTSKLWIPVATIGVIVLAVGGCAQPPSAANPPDPGDEPPAGELPGGDEPPGDGDSPPDCPPLPPVDEPASGPIVCGDGAVGADWEECDPPGVCGCDDDEVCSTACQCVEKNVCHNGIVEPGEECDDSHYGPLSSIVDGQCSPGQACLNCECVPAGICGDGVKEYQGEECEPEVCWIGTSGEICKQDLGCREDEFCNATTCECEPGYVFEEVLCGNGTVDPGEECDGSDLTRCVTAAICVDCRCIWQANVCGNGYVEGDEECETNDLSRCHPSQSCEDCQCAGVIIAPDPGDQPGVEVTGVDVCDGPDVTVEIFPVYDCTKEGLQWVYYEGMRCYAADGTQLFDGRISEAKTSSVWLNFCPNREKADDEEEEKKKDDGDDGGECIPGMAGGTC